LLATNVTGLTFWLGFPIFYVIGCAHQDYRKQLDASPQEQQFYKETSLLPFQAMIEGRAKKPYDIPTNPFLASAAVTLGAYAIRYSRGKL